MCEYKMKFKIFLLLLVSEPAFAEVSDKMATMSQLWMQGVIVGSVLLLLIWWSRWFAILGIPVAMFFGLASYSTFSDPYVGPAIINEQGIPYIISSYGSSALIFIGVIVGVLLNRAKLNATHNQAN